MAGNRYDLEGAIYLLLEAGVIQISEGEKEQLLADLLNPVPRMRLFSQPINQKDLHGEFGGRQPYETPARFLGGNWRKPGEEGPSYLETMRMYDANYAADAAAAERRLLEMIMLKLAAYVVFIIILEEASSQESGEK